MTTAQLRVGTSGWSYADWVGPFYPPGTAPRDHLACYCREFGAVEIDSTFYVLATHRIALVLPDLYYVPKLDRLTTEFAYIRLLGKRSAVPDDFSHVRIDRGCELDLWAGRIRGYLARGVSVFVFVNNHCQGLGPATARGLLSRFATPVSVP